MEPREPIIRNEFFPRPTGDDVVRACYVREVTLAHYGEDHPFGTYDRETGELIIHDAQAMGDFSAEQVKSCFEAPHMAIGSYILFGVPRKVWELRERAKYANPEDL